jgi:hypothetical protein
MPSAPDADRGAPPATQRPEHAHLFCPSGFLDDTWWHRTYWLYGTTFVSGWCGYFRAGKNAPAGRILALDDSKVFGFGRKPQYYRWTTPIEHHLFATDRELPRVDPEAAEKAQGHHVKYHWSQELPLFVRAMVLAEGTLFVAGPPDEVNEEDTFKRFDAPETQQKLAAQNAALAGRKGALLWAVSANDGSRQAEYQIQSPPVFDGMIAAGERLYLATTDGAVLCFSGNE